MTHTHKYKRVKWGPKKTLIYRCMLPGCRHYLAAQFIEGKTAVCWKCGGIFIVTSQSLRRVKLVCHECLGTHKIIGEEDKSKFNQLLDGLILREDVGHKEEVK